MAKVIAPFKIKGTLDDLNYVVTADGNNYVRMKGKTGITAAQFKANPIFDPIRQQAQEFKYCVHKSKIFRSLASNFNTIAKDGSFAGRVNKLLLEILEEDLTESKGKRTLDQALKTQEAKEALLYFESNKLRPLRQVLKTTATIIPEKQTITLTNFNSQNDLDWPEGANEVRFCMATANWDYQNDSFETCYSDEIILNKESETQTLTLTTNKPLENHLHLTFLSIYFATKERKKVKLLHRKFNSCTIVAYYTSTDETLKPLNP
ncbi:hypothetical protein [Flavobacterium sp. UMI-01]|uniref:hypothetical protein n=1 Tax=Flavobacterium sp. UMI-01 TaxID=1441053 RepID=UPI001C7D1E60|nr:hypothetical protein [Flavobacterium sp. UMI-01]GIZ07445.1 hypothetical protein FUMI01_01720 [Flavobacterium sp. UMI-01]